MNKIKTKKDWLGFVCLGLIQIGTPSVANYFLEKSVNYFYALFGMSISLLGLSAMKYNTPLIRDVELSTTGRKVIGFLFILVGITMSLSSILTAT